MRRIVRGKTLLKTLTWLCSLSAATLPIAVPGQAIAIAQSSPTQNGNVRQPLENLSSVQEANSGEFAQTTTAANPKLASRLVLNLRERRVYVYQNDRVVARYPVAIGRPGWETPTGDFQVLDMQKNPAWIHPFNGKVIPPGSDNPLGVRWIGFWTDGNNFIGFHGTPQENLIGQAVSHGCVRMRNKDIGALFEQVALGTPVIVQR